MDELQVRFGDVNMGELPSRALLASELAPAMQHPSAWSRLGRHRRAQDLVTTSGLVDDPEVVFRPNALIDKDEDRLPIALFNDPEPNGALRLPGIQQLFADSERW